MKRVAVLAVLLAAALWGGAGRSQAVFVASAGNPANSVGTAAVFNAVSVTLTDPGTPLRSTVTLAASATSDRPMVSVRFQTAPAGSGAWTDRCTDIAAPYTCSWDTTAVAEGLYDVRAIALDANNYSQTATVTNRRVENTPPSVTMTDPGSPLTGTRTIGATASDTGGTGVATVAFEYRTSPSGTWTPLCSDSSAPYSCAWNTAARPDGLYDLRATATDVAGNTNTSIVSNRRLDNTAPTVSGSDDGTPKRGTVLVSATTGDGNGSGVASVQYQFRPSGGTTWTNACQSTAAPFTCNVDTTLSPDGLYEMRAIATDGAGFSATSATITNVRIDNTIPSAAAMNNPGTPLSGTVTLSGTGSDAGSGVGSIAFEYRPTGGSTWTSACSDTTSPYSCGWNTTTVADGSYEFRAVVADRAGNTRNSATVTARIVDNNGPVVSVTGPAQVRGTANTVTTSVTDASAISSVAIRYRPTGGGSYTTICTDTTAPTYTCTWNVSALADGNYDLIALATDALGRATTSAVYSSRVNNTGPVGTDVQSTNGGVNDRLDSGDRVTFTFSAQIAPASVLPGWSGSPTPIWVRVNNSGTSDSMEFYDAANTNPLNLLAAGTALAINADHVSQPSVFSATISQPTTTTIRVTIGSLISGAVRATATGSSPMIWQPNAAMTNMAGVGLYPATVTESGLPDVDF